jgi:hypothetical protein
MSNAIGVLIAEAFNQASMPYLPSVEVRFLNVAARLVQERRGVALLDEMTASSGHYADLVFRPFRPRIKLTLDAILSAQRTPSQLVSDFVSIFTTEAKQRLASLAATNGQ